MTPRAVVLLEDDPADAHLIERALAGLNLSITLATTRADFLQALAVPRVDLILSDGSVPGLSALEALQISRTQHPDSALVVLSGFIDPVQAARVKDAGAVDTVSKADLGKLAAIVASVLEDGAAAQRVAALERQKGDLERSKNSALRLVKAVSELSEARDVATIQRIVRQAARELNGADGATFVLREGDCCYYADEDAIGPLWKGKRFPLATCVSGWAMEHREPAVIPNIEHDPRVPLDAYRPTFVRSLVMVPIRLEQPIGAIGNYWATEHAATPEEIELIQALANSTAVALENVRVHEELEQRVRERTAELQEANRSLEEFSYFASHDLRAPVRHVGAFAQILEQEAGAQLGPEARRALQSIQSAGTTMAQLLEGLLGLAHVGRKSLQRRALDMTKLAQQAGKLATEHADAHVELRIAELPQALGDEVLVGQVWANLIGNAVKYSGKRVRPIVEVGSREVDGQLQYYVRDNGVGFDMALASKLFGAFGRLHSGAEFPGSGVGLAVVHRIVTRHGGRVWAEAVPDRGATFYFTL